MLRKNIEVNIEAVAHRCSVAVLKNQKESSADVLQNRFSLKFRNKLQACNFPVTIAKTFKNNFFHKTSAVAASEKFINFPGKHHWRRRN